MYFSMVINESLVSRTFGTYMMRIFGEGSDSWLVHAFGVGLIVVAFVVNLLGNQVVGGLSKVTAIVKIVGIAAFAGVIASIFAVSRMLAMLMDMQLVPHSHFGMLGRIQKHTLVYSAVIALAITVFFDQSRIASLGAVFYIVMDTAIHWGVFRSLRKDMGAHSWVLLTALVLDAIVLSAFLISQAHDRPARRRHITRWDEPDLRGRLVAHSKGECNR